MISLNEVPVVCDRHLSMLAGPAHGVTSSPTAVPVYSPEQLRPEICQRALDDQDVRSTCRTFYQSLPNEAGQIICPFGISLIYQRTLISGRHVCLYQQADFVPNVSAAQGLPRRLKKIVKRALRDPKEFALGLFATQKFDVGRELIQTLLTGRVAESIRALSHHLLTPLQGALADVDALKSGEITAEEASLRLTRNLSQVSASAKQIQILLSDDAEFSAQKLRKVHPRSIIRDLFDSFQSEAAGRHINLEHSPNQHTREVEAIPDQLFLVLSSLIQNAYKYSFDGAEGSPRTVRVTYDSKGEDLVIIVQNEGCGIDDDEIKDGRLYELGYRGRHSADRGREGTGTGLYIVDKIAAAHGATVFVSSARVGVPSQPEFQAYRNRFELHWPIYSPLKRYDP